MSHSVKQRAVRGMDRKMETEVVTKPLLHHEAVLSLSILKGSVYEIYLRVIRDKKKTCQDCKVYEKTL